MGTFHLKRWHFARIVPRNGPSVLQKLFKALGLDGWRTNELQIDSSKLPSQVVAKNAEFPITHLHLRIYLS